MSDGLLMKYFVLKPAGKDAFAQASRKGMLAFAEAICSSMPDLSTEVRKWADREESNAAPDAEEAE